MASKNLKELVHSLDQAVGVSGFEVLGDIFPVLKEEMEGYYDEYYEDGVHNQIYVRKGGEKKVLLAAHTDELGFIVSHVGDDGMIRFAPIGYHDDRGCIDQKLCIHTKKGPVYGVTGSKPAHILSEEESKTVIEIPNLFIDIGATSKEEAMEMGVLPGCIVSWTTQGEYLNGTDTYSGKSVDDRAGVAIMVEVMRRLKEENINNVTFYAVGTVQEELGCRGAGVAANHIQPDVAIALDVTLAYGPDTPVTQVPMEFGGGACVKLYDWSPNLVLGVPAAPELTEKMIEVAEEKGIKYQREILMDGATDATFMQTAGSGCLAGCISMPSRYIHTAIGTVHLKDLEACVDLVVEYVKTL